MLAFTQFQLIVQASLTKYNISSRYTDTTPEEGVSTNNCVNLVGERGGKYLPLVTQTATSNSDRQRNIRSPTGTVKYISEVRLRYQLHSTCLPFLIPPWGFPEERFSF